MDELIRYSLDDSWASPIPPFGFPNNATDKIDHVTLIIWDRIAVGRRGRLERTLTDTYAMNGAGQWTI